MRGISWAVIFYLFMLVADLISTLMLGDLVVHLESNPLFKYAGFAGIILLNLGVAAGFYYGYKYSKRAQTRHAFLYCLVFISVIRIFIVYNNYQVYLNPPTLAAAAAITTAVKTKFVLIKVVQPFVMAFIPAWFTFALFERDHHITKIEADK